MKKNLKFPLPISHNFEEAKIKRFVKYFRYDNSEYWEEYYKNKLQRKDISREKVYSDIILRYVGTGGKVIDVGCGFGFFAKELNNAGLNVEGVDLFEKMLNNAAKYLNGTKVKVRQADLLNLPYPKCSLDCIALESILEHFPEAEVRDDILPYVRGLLKKRGYLFVHFPVLSLNSMFTRLFRKFVIRDLPEWAIDDDADITHKMWLSYKSYIKLIRESGFKLMNYDFRLTRSNMKPKQLWWLMTKVQRFLDYFSDPMFFSQIENSGFFTTLAKKIKANSALTGYMLFQKP